MNAFKNRYGLIEIDLQNHRARRDPTAHWFRDGRALVLDIGDEYR
jgi:beta-glucosidase